MKKYILPITMFSMALIISCGGDSSQTAETTAPEQKEEPKANPRGVGPNMEVTLNDPVNADMATNGKATYDMKCASCHKLDKMRVVGPGFADITNRRKPEWIMNMITNTEVMLDEDPTAQALLEECLMRMPNQNLSTSEARDVLEFLRKNDEDAVGKRDGAVNS